MIREADKVARAFGRSFTKSILSRKESGELPTAPQLYALSRALKVSADEMLARIAKDYGAGSENDSVTDAGVRELELSEDALRIAEAFDEADRDVKRLILLATFGHDAIEKQRPA